IESVKDSDYCILVTEPTPFGYHDLTLAVEVVRELDIPCGVIGRSERFSLICYTRINAESKERWMLCLDLVLKRWRRRIVPVCALRQCSSTRLVAISLKIMSERK
ncbi:MAG: hypothetical protein ACE5PV_11015, partial [Candidatus Poribacteria bacterium]